MITLKEVYQLNERADFQYVASELVKYYGLRSKIKFGVSKNKADYDFDNDINTPKKPATSVPKTGGSAPAPAN